MARDFVAKTLLETTRAIEQSVFQMDLASKGGFLQGLDPRTKIVSFMVLLLAVSFSRSFLLLVSFYCLSLVLAALSQVPPGRFVKRVWVFVPLFTGFVALPAVLNLVTPGENVLTILSFGSDIRIGPFDIPDAIYITRQGLYSAAFLVVRVAVSVSLAVLLVLTTRWMDLLQGLSILRVPGMVILVLAMTYRYIHLFLRGLENMLLARKSRRLVPSGRKDEQGWISSRLGVLVGKSYHLSTEVHMAMMSRGWSGNPRCLHELRFSGKDILTMAAALAVSVSGIVLEKIC